MNIVSSTKKNLQGQTVLMFRNSAARRCKKRYHFCEFFELSTVLEYNDVIMTGENLILLKAEKLIVGVMVFPEE